MPRFSQASLKRLQTCDPKLQRLFLKVGDLVDISVLCGHRDQESQQKAFFSGASRLQWPQSRHNKIPSQAIDVAPYPIVWTRTDQFHLLGGFVLGVAESEGIQIRWGGDWDMDFRRAIPGFEDLVHFELI